MTADEALAWIEEHDVEVERSTHFERSYQWCVGVSRHEWIPGTGSTLVEAVERLRDKLESP